jgi:DNA-directed RNA polymerase specialized sigma24 family protein
MQTGGSKKTWLFDPTDIPSTINDQLVHYDHYFFEEQGESTLAIVLDRILDDLPQDLADPVRLVYLRGKSDRAAARILGIDHKTVKARRLRGVEQMRKRLTDSVWIAEMLRGYIPKDEITQAPVKGNDISDVLRTLKEDSND